MRIPELCGTTVVAAALGISTLGAQSPPGQAPASLRSVLGVEPDAAGNVDLTLRTERGYRYALQASPDLASGNWGTAANVYGLGQTPRFRVLTNTNPPPGATPTEPPIASFTFNFVDLGNGDVHVSWTEAASDFAVIRPLAFPVLEAPIWQ